MSGAIVWGKLPAHGDFVARGLTPPARDSLDAWLAASLAEARAALGDAFEEEYDAAPPWRFAWRTEHGWTAGAIAPSVDGVGRRYPILAARDALPADATGGIAAAAEELLYDALGEGWDADRLHAATAGLSPPPGAATGEGWWTLGGERFTERRLAGARPAGLMTAMLSPDGSAGGDA